MVGNHRKKLLHYLVPVLVTCVLSACSARAPAPAASHDVRASALLASALAAAEHAGSVHYTEKFKIKGKPASMVGDVALQEGSQQISDVDGTVMTVVSTTGAYFRGDAGTLVNSGFSSSEAKADQKKWVFVPRSDPRFANISFLVTLPTVLSFITPASPLRLTGSSMRNGQLTEGITGGTPKAGSGGTGEATLYISEHSQLPVAFVWRGNGASSGISWTFSNWGKHVEATPPAT